MIYIVNIEKKLDEKVGIYLTNYKKKVYIHDIKDYANVDIRKNILIGDNIISINGIKATDAMYLSKFIIKNNSLSICLSREHDISFEKNKKKQYF